MKSAADPIDGGDDATDPPVERVTAVSPGAAADRGLEPLWHGPGWGGTHASARRGLETALSHPGSPATLLAPTVRRGDRLP